MDGRANRAKAVASPGSLWQVRVPSMQFNPCLDSLAAVRLTNALIRLKWSCFNMMQSSELALKSVLT